MVPPPWRLVAVIVPPCASTIPLQIAKTETLFHSRFQDEKPDKIYQKPSPDLQQEYPFPDRRFDMLTSFSL